MLRFRYASKATLAAFFLLASVFRADVGTAQIADAAVGTLFAGVAGIAIVDKLEEKFRNVKALADSSINLASGNGLVVTQSAILGLRQAFATERAIVFERLSSERRQMIVDLYRTLDDIEHKINLQRGYLKADITNVMNNVALLTDKVDFLITAIDPITVTYQTGGDYNIRIVGVGVGAAPSNLKYDVKVWFDGSEIKRENIQQLPDTLIVRIPYDAISSKFPDRDMIARIPLKISSDVTKACGFFNWRTCVAHNEFSFDLNLYPKAAAYAVVNQTAKRLTLVNEQERHTNEVETPDLDDEPGQLIQSPPMTADPGYQIVSASYDPNTCRPKNSDGEDTCAFMYNPNCTISAGGHVAQCTVVSESHPKFFSFKYVIAEEKYVPDELPQSQPIVFEAINPQSISFRDDASIVSFDVTLFDGRTGRYSLRPGDVNNSPFMLCGSAATVGTDEARVDCRLQIVD